MIGRFLTRARVFSAVTVAGLLMGAVACGTPPSASGPSGPPCILGDHTRMPTVHDELPTDLGALHPTDLQLETPGFGAESSAFVHFPSLSADESKLAFFTTSQAAIPGGYPGNEAFVVRDRVTGTNTLVNSVTESTSFGNRETPYPYLARIQPDGSVVFAQAGYAQPVPPDAPDVQLGDPAEFQSQVFRWNPATAGTEVLSLGVDGLPLGSADFATGAEKPEVSADGRYLFFTARTAILPGETVKWDIDLFRRDLVTGEIQQVNVGNQPAPPGLDVHSTGDVSSYSISADGTVVAFSAPALGSLSQWGRCAGTGPRDFVFVRDLTTGVTRLVSNDNSGRLMIQDAQPEVSPDGRWVVWNHYIYDRTTGLNQAMIPWNHQMFKTIDHDAEFRRFLILIGDDRIDDIQNIAPDGDGAAELVIFDRIANTIQRVDVAPEAMNPLKPCCLDGYDLQDAFFSPSGGRLFFSTNTPLVPEDTWEGGPGPYDGYDLYSVAL